MTVERATYIAQQPVDSEASSASDHDAVQQLVRLEDMLLLSRYEEVAQASAELVSSFSERGKAGDDLLQRALVITFQAHFFIGRHSDINAMLDKLGLARLRVPTFMAWALLLLESGQAATARRRVEQYMSTVMAHIQEQGCEAASHCAIDDAAAAAVPQSRGDGCESWRQAPIKAGTAAESAAKKSWHGMADPVALVGVATATLPDRMALARLYSQDVLCLGLGLPLEALYWLQSILDTTGSQQQHLCCGKVNESAQLGSNVGIPAVAATAGVVDANELLGRCPETLQRLRDELNQLIAISGMAPLGLPDFTAATITGNRLSIDALAMVAVPGAVPGDRAASQIPHRGADGKVSAGDSRGAPTVPRRLQNNGTGHQQPIVSQLESGHASFLLFRALLASLHAAVRRLALGASLQLTRAQTWLICKVTAVAARLRDMSACRHAAAAGSWGRSIKRAAAMAGLAAVILLALQAEAPHVRTNMERQAGWIAGMVQDALRMGFALQPSPVAAGGPPMP